MGGAGGRERMIAMLRRRLMSNMAKAKNIATGTVNAVVVSAGVAGTQKHSSLTVTDLDFMPTNVVVVRAAVASQSILCVWDSTSYYSGSNGGLAGTVTRSFNANGFVMEQTGTLGSGGLFGGAYNYVAWQE